MFNLMLEKTIREMDKWGGVVIDIPYTMGVSSTSILDAIENIFIFKP